MNFTPIPPDSEKYSLHELIINRRVEEIAAGRGTFEVPFYENGTTQLGLLPFHWFCFYIEHEKYPHPALLRYFARVFADILDDRPFDKAAGLARGRGRPRTEANEKRATERDFLGLKVWQLINNESFKVEFAIEETARQLKANKKSVERAYYENKDEFDAFIPKD